MKPHSPLASAPVKTPRELTAHLALIAAQVSFGLFPVFGTLIFRPGGLTPLGVAVWRLGAGAAVLLLLAVVGFGTVAWGILTAKPGWLAFVYVLFYIILLYSLFLALRVGLEPRDLAGSRDAPQTIPVR